MVTIIRAKTHREKIKQLFLLADRKTNLLDATKYSGKIKLNGKSLSIQKKLK